MLLVAQTWTSASNSSTGGSLCKGVYGRFMEGGALLLLPLWSTTAMDGTRQLWACIFDQKYRNTTGTCLRRYRIRQRQRTPPRCGNQQDYLSLVAGFWKGPLRSHLLVR